MLNYESGEKKLIEKKNQVNSSNLWHGSWDWNNYKKKRSKPQ
jgi:hypothetical protein